MPRTPKDKYEIEGPKGMWTTCTKAQTQLKGWLHYELAQSGTIGLARPGTWRVKAKKNSTKIVDT